MAWTDQQKTDLIAAYLAAEPTAESSTEIVKDLAETFEQSANGCRQVLVQANVYVKKTPAPAAKTAAKAADGSEKAPRVSKESSIAALTSAIEAKELPVDEEILSKLTGKAAVYILSLLQ